MQENKIIEECLTFGEEQLKEGKRIGISRRIVELAIQKTAEEISESIEKIENKIKLEIDNDGFVGGKKVIKLLYNFRLNLFKNAKK